MADVTKMTRSLRIGIRICIVQICAIVVTRSTGERIRMGVTAPSYPEPDIRMMI